jgi:hypothetical protein
VKIYKYRDLSRPDEVVFDRLERIIRRRAFWCARPDTLNDPQEFGWRCDFSISPNTPQLLTDLLIHAKGRTWEEARLRVVNTINRSRLPILAEPVIADMIRQCRDAIGLACFGTSADNETLWERYAGAGAGVCIEVEVPNTLLNTQLHRVTYSDDRRIHLDTFLRARLDPQHAADVYAVSLLSKPSFWEPEQEIRFISKRQRVNLVIEGSHITRVIMGPMVEQTTIDRIRQMADKIPVVLDESTRRPNIGLQPSAAGTTVSRRGCNLALGRRSPRHSEDAQVEAKRRTELIGGLTWNIHLESLRRRHLTPSSSRC